MALERKDSIKDQTQTTGTGSVTVDLITSTGYKSMAAHTTGATVRYRIYNSLNTEWEVGQGTWNNPVLTRDIVYASSNSDALVNFSAGIKVVMTVPVAADLSQLQVYIQGAQPTDPNPYLWFQTGLGDGTGFTLWINS